MSSLDIVNAVAYLAFFEKDEALGLDFHIDHMYNRHQSKENKEEQDDLISEITDSEDEDEERD